MALMAVMNWKPFYYKRIVLGRLQLSIRVYRHQYTMAPDRWVFQPELIWDRSK